MKCFYIMTLLFLFMSCKNNKSDKKDLNTDDTKLANPVVIDHTKTKNTNLKPIDKSTSIELKQKQFIEKKDESDELQKLIIDKRYLVEKKAYTINFRYPLLDESFKPTNANFNEFINNYYVNIARTEEDILERKLLCDSITAKTCREGRFIDYKINYVNDRIVSVLFYKENFYNEALHPIYSFDCFNFDLNRGVFMTYEDFFNPGSEEELIVIINESINEQIGKGDLYYDCWEISSTDFFESKNNFVLNDNYLEFYFDDCVICPSYTGTYSIKFQLMDLLSVLKKYESNPLVF